VKKPLTVAYGTKDCAAYGSDEHKARISAGVTASWKARRKANRRPTKAQRDELMSSTEQLRMRFGPLGKK
jgi:hypothetical protein